MSSVKTNSDVSKVTLAAEELIKAASMHVESTSLEIGNQTVQELKKVSMSSSKLEQRLLDFKESVDSKINTLNQKLATMESNLNASITLVNQSVAQQTKNQSLCWAIENVEVNQFEFSKPNSGITVKSGQFVKETLLYFRSGFGRLIPSEYCLRYSTAQAFRNALSKQIHELLGQKPLITLKEGSDDVQRVH